jgi:hypothetical protein
MKRVLCLLVGLIGSAAAGVTRGEIGGAQFMIAAPEKWQGKLVLIAHGFRQEGSPLDAEFDVNLTNQDELEHPKHYRTKAGPEKTALWEVKRDGHCNTSDSERLQALLAVDAWVDGAVPANEKDGTVYPPVRESTAKKVDGGLEGKVTLASESWGNLSIGFVAADLTALGLKSGDHAVVSGGKGKLAVKVVGYRSDVEPGEGALYLAPNGWVAVVINGGNAAKAIGVTTGDVVVLAKEGDLE